MRYLLIVMFSAASTLFAQLSPGDLTNAHAEFEGMSNCTKCHEIGEPVHNSKCLECHSEIKELVDAGRGYHAGAEVIGKDCSECHSEHHGRNFEIIRFDQKKFDHNSTGYILEGKHKQIECEDCHNGDNIPNPDLKKRAKTFLGLSGKCSNCHVDYHQKTLSDNCENCHGFNSFRPATNFDHSSARFILDGGHKNVKCADCHKMTEKNGSEFQVFKGVKFNSCIDCHKDIHNGKLGDNCESCHSTISFKNIKNKERFDHDKTGFKLIGKHNNVECRDCHKNGLTAKLKYQNCYNCHTDFHNGQFTENGKITDCNACHNINGFKPSLFSIEKHNESGFMLMGSHLAVPCENCHRKENLWNFGFENNKCITCHENVHGNTIGQKYWHDGNCESCHGFNSWQVAKFNHSETGFELIGKHKNLDCGSCHKTSDGSNVSFKFSSLSGQCEDCHNDIHYGQFRSNGKTNCEACHAFADWRPVKFSHVVSRFKLDGAHKNVPCIKCHSKIEQNGREYIKYKFDEIKCSNCHS